MVILRRSASTSPSQPPPHARPPCGRSSPARQEAASARSGEQRQQPVAERIGEEQVRRSGREQQRGLACSTSKMADGCSFRLFFFLESRFSLQRQQVCPPSSSSIFSRVLM